VPKLLEHLFGTQLGFEYPTITTILFLLILFYGADFAYQKLSKLKDASLIRQQLDGLILEVSDYCKIPEEALRRLLAGRYAKGKMRPLIQSVMRVFRPSKQHSNSGLRISGRRIEPRLVAEVPGDAQMLEFDEPPHPKPMHGVEIELHAQDMDYVKQGWAAIIPSLSKQRIRLELSPPIRPIDIYTKSKIKGDVIILFRETKSGVTAQPGASADWPRSVSRIA
jgi:hypothetical protein